MTTNPNSTVDVQITDEALREAKKLTDKLVNHEKMIQEKIKNDTKGFYTIKQACRYIFSEADVAKDEEEQKNNNETTSLNKLWEAFKNCAQKIAKWASNFLIKIKEEKGISIQTKIKLRNVLKDFKELLFDTSRKLQLYRFDIEKMIDTFNDILELLVPPEDVFEELHELDQNKRLKRCAEFAKENQDELSEQLSTLASQMSDDTTKKSLSKLSEEWKTLQEKLESVVSEIKEEIEAFKTEIRKMKGIIIAFVGVIGLAAVAITGGAAALIPTFTIGGKLGAFGLALAGVGTCLAIYFGYCVIHNPKLGELLEFSKSESIKVITNGLKEISSQSDRMGTMLFKLYTQWTEVMKNQSQIEKKARQKYTGFRKTLKLQGLFKTLNETKTGLDDLRYKIKETENVCHEQLDIFTEKLYKPLMDLF